MTPLCVGVSELAVALVWAAGSAQGLVYLLDFSPGCCGLHCSIYPAPLRPACLWAVSDCLSPCHVIEMLRSSCFWDSQAGSQKQTSVLKACSWTGNSKYVGFSFSGVWCAVDPWNWLRNNLFGLLMSPFKIEASSPPSSRKNNLGMNWHGSAHLLWNFSPLKWGDIWTGASMRAVCEGKKLWWNVSHRDLSGWSHMLQKPWDLLDIKYILE